MIEEGLQYVDTRGCWVTKYLYLHSKDLLRGSREVAMKSMLSMEYSLKKDSNWARVYQLQIQDMLAKGAARIVSEKEFGQWDGVVNYIPHLAALIPSSTSTPVRIVFDASQVQGKGQA